jgi:hypothetical protein
MRLSRDDFQDGRVTYLTGVLACLSVAERFALGRAIPRRTPLSSDSCTCVQGRREMLRHKDMFWLPKETATPGSYFLIIDYAVRLGDSLLLQDALELSPWRPLMLKTHLLTLFDAAMSDADRRECACVLVSYGAERDADVLFAAMRSSDYTLVRLALCGLKWCPRDWADPDCLRPRTLIRSMYQASATSHGKGYFAGTDRDARALLMHFFIAAAADNADFVHAMLTHSSMYLPYVAVAASCAAEAGAFRALRYLLAWISPCSDRASIWQPILNAALRSRIVSCLTLVLHWFSVRLSREQARRAYVLAAEHGNVEGMNHLFMVYGYHITPRPARRASLLASRHGHMVAAEAAHALSAV